MVGNEVRDHGLLMPHLRVVSRLRAKNTKQQTKKHTNRGTAAAAAAATHPAHTHMQHRKREKMIINARARPASMPCAATHSTSSPRARSSLHT